MLTVNTAGAGRASGEDLTGGGANATLASPPEGGGQVGVIRRGLLF